MNLRSRSGFSLSELLIVVAILGVLMALAAPAFRSVAQGNSLTRAGQVVSDLLVQAGQDAVSRNRPTMVQFIQLPDETGRGGEKFRGLQISTTDREGNPVVLSKLERLPTGIVFSELPDLSPLLSTPPATERTLQIGGANRVCREISLRPSGQLASPVADNGSFMTLVEEKTANAENPQNFYAIYLNPVTGQVSTFRP